MTNEELIEILYKQDEMLRFDTVSEAMLCEIGEKIAASAKAVCILIRINGLEIYSRILPGAARNNRKWAERKGNMAEFSGKSSMLAALENRAKGRSVSDLGLDSSGYVLEGGAFPVKLRSGLVIGSIAVSGMPSECDHQSICDAAASVLGISVPSIIS